MNFLRKCAMTAGVVCAATSASAQYYPYAAPATLPAPTAQMRQIAYQDTGRPTPPVPAPMPQSYADQYNQAVAAPEGCSSCNTGCSSCDTGCTSQGDWGCSTNCCAPCWYGNVAALYMNRSRPNPYQLSFDTTNPVGELMLNIDSIDEWQFGGEVSVGRRIGCNGGVDFTFWTLDDFGGQAMAFDPPGVGGLNTPIDFRTLAFGATPVNDIFDGAQAHRLTRSNELYNFEINYTTFASGDPCSRFRSSMLAGVRYFRFDEGWQFASSDGNVNFGVDPANEGYYNIDVENNLLGLQLGGRGSFLVTDYISVYAAPRFGAYWNHVDHRSTIVSGTGVRALDVDSSADVVSFMAQLDVGASYQITCNLSAYAGYRIVAFTNVALADDQVPYLQDDLFGIADVDHNGALVLHGLMTGLTWSY